jgi:hypothetical protein
VALVPLQPPDHPANLEPDLAAAVSLTDVPGVNFAAHVLPQLTPEGLLVTVPAPVPALFTVSWTGVEAPAMQGIPHRPRNNNRQEKLPRIDLNVAITPPRGPYVLMKFSGLPLPGEGSIRATLACLDWSWPHRYLSLPHDERLGSSASVFHRLYPAVWPVSTRRLRSPARQ